MDSCWQHAQPTNPTSVHPFIEISFEVVEVWIRITVENAFAHNGMMIVGTISMKILLHLRELLCLPCPSVEVILKYGEKMDEGRFVQAVAWTWFRLATKILGDPSIMYTIGAERWEEILAGIYREAGFDEVLLTRRSGDFGRDVIAVRRNIWPPIRVIDQMKAYKPGHRVTAEEVRAMIGVLQVDHQATLAVVTTTSKFAPKVITDPYIRPLIPYRLLLIDGEKLVERISTLLPLCPEPDRR